MRQANAGRRGVDDSRLGRKISRGVGGDGAGHAVVIALHRLIHALGERQVRDCVVRIAQRVGLDIQRCLFGFAGGRQTCDAPWVRGDVGFRDLIDELLAVHHVAGLDRLDGDVRGGLGGSQRIGDQGKLFAQGIDELVHLDGAVAIVQSDLKLVPQQGAQALAVANAFDKAHREAHAIGR